MRSRRTLQVLLAAVAAMVALAQFFPGTSSSFTDTTTNTGNRVAAKADWTAPTIPSTVLQKAEGGTTAKIAQGGSFYIYANASDTGNPAAGVSAVTATVDKLTSSATAPMTAGSWTVAGTAYSYRTAALTAKNPLTAGSTSYTVTASDSAGNGPASATGSVTADSTAFTPVSATTVSVGATPGKPEKTDQLTLAYNKAPDPNSIIAGWNGSAYTLNVTMADGGLYGFSSTTQDLMGPTDSSGNMLGIGYVILGGDFVATSKTVVFTGSTMTLSGSTLTITLGTPDVSANVKTDTGSRAAVWNSLNTVYDQFGNDSSAAAITGAARKQF